MMDYKTCEKSDFVHSRPEPNSDDYRRLKLWHKVNGSAKKIFFQTPIVPIIFNYNHNKMCISLFHKNIDDNVKMFYEFIKMIDSINASILKQKKWFKKKNLKYNSIIRKFHSIPFIPLKLSNDFTFYNYQKKKTNY